MREGILAVERHQDFSSSVVSACMGPAVDHRPVGLGLEALALGLEPYLDGLVDLWPSLDHGPVNLEASLLDDLLPLPGHGPGNL